MSSSSVFSLGATPCFSNSSSLGAGSRSGLPSASCRTSSSPSLSRTCPILPLGRRPCLCMPTMAAPYVFRNPTSAGVRPSRLDPAGINARATRAPLRFSASAPETGLSSASMTVFICSRVVDASIAWSRQMLTERSATADASQCRSCTRRRFRPWLMSCNNPGRSAAETPRTTRRP